MSAVWKDSKQKGSSLLLLLAFADHAGDDGFCWPGYEHLAKKIRMSTRSVSRLVEQLEKDKELHVIRKQGEHNWYVVRVGMTNEDVIAVLKGRRMDTPDNLSALVGQETHDNFASRQDTATPEPETEQCHPNLHDPSSSNRQEEPPTADSPSADEWPAELVAVGEDPAQEEVDPVAAFKSRHAKDPLALAAESERKRAEVEHPDFADPTKDSQSVMDVYYSFGDAFLGMTEDQLDRKPNRHEIIAKLYELSQQVEASVTHACQVMKPLAVLEEWFVGPSATPYNKRWAEAFQNALLTDIQVLKDRAIAKLKRAGDSGRHDRSAGGVRQDEKEVEELRQAVNRIFDETGMRRKEWTHG
jgi:hypothetical protein